MTNITNLIVINITVRSCLGNEYNNATVLIKQCTNVQLRHVVIEENHNSYGIVGINILGDSQFTYISSNILLVIYNNSDRNTQYHSLSIDHYHINCISNKFQYRVILAFCTSVKFQLLNSTFQDLRNTTAIHILSEDKNYFLFKHCKFSNNSGSLLDIQTKNTHADATRQCGMVQLEDCEFVNNLKEPLFDVIIVIRYPLLGPDLLIYNCTFHYNNYSMILLKKPSTYALMTRIFVTITIYRTNFSSNFGYVGQNLISVSDAKLQIKGPVVFYNITNLYSVIYIRRSNMIYFNYIEFAMLNADTVLKHRHFYHVIFLHENTVINITQNKFRKFFKAPDETLTGLYSPCYFQYLSKSKLDINYKGNIFSIIFKNNIYDSSQEFAYNNLLLAHCIWLPNSAFNTSIPLDVNKQFIKYINSSGMFDFPQILSLKKTICNCNDNASQNCYGDFLPSIYSEQTKEIKIYTDALEIQGVSKFDTLITAIQNIDGTMPTACVVTDSSQITQVAKSGSCSTLKYSIAFPQEKWCELFLKGMRDGIDKTDIYYIKELSCPAGFIKINGTCQCHSFLKNFNIKCDIDDQTLIRPTNTWIAPIFQNYSYNTFHFSLHCPFHYCLPHSSHLDFSTPNSQCQFNRSGILCGYCQQGLSTAFGSSHCQQCSNIYLFLIVPIAIAGLCVGLTTLYSQPHSN